MQASLFKGLARRKPVLLSLDEHIYLLRKASNEGEQSIPKLIITHLSTIRDYGNYASHDQGPGTKISSIVATNCLSLLAEVVQWYCNDYQGLSLRELEPTNSEETSAPGIGSEEPVLETDTQAISGVHENILPADLKFAENPDSNLDVRVKVKSPSQKSDSPKSVEFYSQLKQGFGNLETPLRELFSQASHLGLKLEWGSKSRVVKTAYKVPFPDESLPNASESGHMEKRQGFERNFNFGVFKSTGIFYNRSCERSLGREYLKQLSLLIPGTSVRLHKNEFRNSIVQVSGDPVPLEWILSRKNEWIQLVSSFHKKLKCIGI